MKHQTVKMFVIAVASLALLGAGCSGNLNVNTPTPTQPVAEQNNPVAQPTEQNNNVPQPQAEATPQPVVKPYIKVIYPNGGENFRTGQQVKIKWNSVGVNKIYLSLVNGGKEFGQIVDNGINASLKEYTWTVPENSAGVMTGFKLFFNNGNATNDIRDSSDGTFSILPPTADPYPVQPFLKLVTPTGNQQFRTGQKVTISWTSSGVNKVYLSLVNSGKEFGQLAPDGVIASLGKFEWTVPDMSDWDVEAGYKIFITNNDSTSELRDSSAVSFSIVK